MRYDFQRTYRARNTGCYQRLTRKIPVATRDRGWTETVDRRCSPCVNIGATARLASCRLLAVSYPWRAAADADAVAVPENLDLGHTVFSRCTLTTEGSVERVERRSVEEASRRVYAWSTSIEGMMGLRGDTRSCNRVSLVRCAFSGPRYRGRGCRETISAALGSATSVRGTRGRKPQPNLGDVLSGQVGARIGQWSGV